MRESLARIHVHEIPEVDKDISPPPAANDNELPQLSETSLPSAANDNTPIDQEQLAALREKLGISKQELMERVEQPVPEEVPAITPEHLEEIISESSESPEVVPGTEIEENEMQPSEAAAASAGGSKEKSGGGGDQSGGGEKETSVDSGNEKKKGGRGSRWLKRLKGFGKGLFWIILTSPAWLFTLGMTAVIKSTNKILEWAKLSEKGGGNKKSGDGARAPGGRQGGGGGH